MENTLRPGLVSMTPKDEEYLRRITELLTKENRPLTGPEVAAALGTSKGATGQFLRIYGKKHFYREGLGSGQSPYRYALKSHQPTPRVSTPTRHLEKTPPQKPSSIKEEKVRKSRGTRLLGRRRNSNDSADMTMEELDRLIESRYSTMPGKDPNDE